MEINDNILINSTAGDEFIIRRLLKSDRRGLQEFGNSLSKESTASFLPHSYDDDTVNAFLERSETGKDLTLGLFINDKMVAYFFLWYYTNPIPLLGIGILDEYQGKGFGKKLIQFLIDAARRTNRDGIELTTLPDNHRAYTLYEQVGFRHYADVNNLAGDGRVVTERAMFLQFNPAASPSVDLHKPPVDFNP
ncbi:GNAT family N-acetyltransferase [Proteiniphilum sp. UBA5463]|jgi:ribosomal protein S18 acetylase RimI-like enzyme|uniref:GNAT family N-acetyltransferase n=1 Tax=Proteiniphilum sp. UBA5463 TaxID=1947281 RepID=UPI002580C1C9|nr:GNAT family N-acetyltransferase [Proteiniphilum sp. UBA5463]